MTPDIIVSNSGIADDRRTDTTAAPGTCAVVQFNNNIKWTIRKIKYNIGAYIVPFPRICPGSVR